MAKVYKFQSNITITLDTKLNLLGATNFKILYRKPESGVQGEWDANAVEDTKIQYTLADGNIDENGFWHFQAYAEKDGKKLYGEVVTEYFFIPLN